MDIGAGVMPMVSLNDDNPLFDKKGEIGGLLSLGINLSSSFVLEAAYNFGLVANGVSIFETNGNIIDELQNRFQFYTIGLKVKF